MSVFEFPTPWAWMVHHLAGESDSPPPPRGFASWEQYEAVVFQGENAMSIFASPGTVPRGEKCSVIFQREGEDVATIGMHFAHRDGPDLIDFTQDDRVAVEGFIGTLWASLDAYYPPTLALAEYHWHKWGVGIRKPNPNTRMAVLAVPVPGGNGDDQPLAAQVAISVTFKTTTRKNWGRVYLPAPVVSVLDAGRIEDDHVDAIRTAFGNFADSCQGAHLPLVIWSPRRDGHALVFDTKTTGTTHHDAGDDNPDDSSFAKTVDVIQVDNVPDVIRSRRIDRATRKATHTLA